MMNDKIRRALCAALGTAVIFTAAPAVFGADIAGEPARDVAALDVTDPAATADPTATADPSATQEPGSTQSPEASESPSPSETATPLPDVTADMAIIANVYATETKNVYNVNITAKSVPSLTDLEMKVSFSNAEVGTAKFTDDVKNLGTAKVDRGEKDATFTLTDASTPLSGRVVIATISVTTDGTALDKDGAVKIDAFTGTTGEGAKFIGTPKLTVTIGDSLPEATEAEQKVVDMVKALAEPAELSFYDEKGKVIEHSIEKKAAEDARKAYDALKLAERNNIDALLAYEEMSISDCEALIDAVDKMAAAMGIVQIAKNLDGINDTNALEYQFLIEVAGDEDNGFYSSLFGLTKARSEYQAAQDTIAAANTMLQSALKDSAMKDIVTGIESQYSRLQKLGTDKYYSKYIDKLSEIAEDTLTDLKTYTGSDKTTLQSRVEKVVSNLKSNSIIAADLPTMSIGTAYRGQSVSVKLTRNKTYEEYGDAKITVYVKNASGTVINTNEATFKANSKTLSTSVLIPSSVSTRSTVYVGATYTILGTDYDLGEVTRTVTQNANENNSNGNNGGGTVTPPGGTVYPPGSIVGGNDDDDDNNQSKELFSDLANYDWAKPAIEGLYYAGVVNGMGDGTFNPAGNVTREQFATMVVKLFGLSIGTGETSFADVDAAQWYAPYIASAVSAGYIQGQSNDYFGVGESIMRQDMATILYRAMGQRGTPADLSFTDNSQIAGYAEDPVAALVGLGVINGYEDGSFKPRGTATRAEAAKMIWGVYEIIK